MKTLLPGLRSGSVKVPQSKSHAIRLLLSDFLSGDLSRCEIDSLDAEDVIAMKRALLALHNGESEINCRSSATVLRLLSPVLAALGVNAVFKKSPQLAARPARIYEGKLKSGLFDVKEIYSSQDISGLLFALPLLNGESKISYSGNIPSFGYVKMTMQVLKDAGIEIFEEKNSFVVPGNQKYKAQPFTKVESDWSAASIWFLMREMGNDIKILDFDATRASLQPDYKAICDLKNYSPRAAINIDESPDIFPALSIFAASTKGEMCFQALSRLRLKESDRLGAMLEILTRLGVEFLHNASDDSLIIHGRITLRGGEFSTFNDHRIAMALAMASTRAKEKIVIDNEDCVAKSYRTFWDNFDNLKIL